MSIKRILLCPGVWLNYLHTNRFKTGCFSVNLLQPLEAEFASVNALIPSVLLRGCKSYTDMRQISDRLDELYGASIGALIRKNGEVQTIGLYADFLEDRYANGEPIFVQMMSFTRELLFESCLENGGFREEFVEGEKQNLINAITSRINDKRSYAVTRMIKHMFEGEAYATSRLGDEESLEHVSGVSLYERWNKLLSTSKIELFYMGQKSEDDVCAQMRLLTDMLPQRTELCNADTKLVLLNRSVKTVEEEMDVTQGKLTIGFRTPITALDERYPAHMLFNAVYGSGMTSKLFMKIREEMSLCYYASSTIDRLKGALFVSSGIEFEKYQVAKEGILAQLDECKRGNISNDELESARSYLISRLRTINDSPGRLDDYSISQAVAGTSCSVNELIEQLKAVTLEQVVEAANTLVLDTIYFLKGAAKE